MVGVESFGCRSDILSLEGEKEGGRNKQNESQTVVQLYKSLLMVNP